MKSVGVIRYDSRTPIVVMQDKKATGFIGYDAYELKDKENSWNKTTYMLTRYAEYSNIGGNKTTSYGTVVLHL